MKKHKTDIFISQTKKNKMNEEIIDPKNVNRNPQIEIEKINCKVIEQKMNNIEPQKKKNKKIVEVINKEMYNINTKEEKNRKNEELIEQKEENINPRKKKIVKKKEITKYETDYILIKTNSKGNEKIIEQKMLNNNPQIEIEIKNDKDKVNDPMIDNINTIKEKTKKSEETIEQKIENANPQTGIIEINGKKGDKKVIKKMNLNLYKKLDLCSFFPNKANNKISTPGLIGLMNIGATCYMNATLQCFSNIPKLREYLIEKKMYIKLKKYKEIHKLSFALAEVIKNLWENLDKRFYPPENFKNVISEINPIFKGRAANDPKDLILFLLENIHNELNINKGNKNYINNFPLDNNYLIEEFNNYKQNYISQNKSIISDEFYGYSNTITSCNNCQFAINNIQVYNILFFPLEEIRRYKNYNHNNVKIIDCFEYYTKIDFYPNFYCNSCKQNYTSTSKSMLINSPHTLIVNLNRGKGLEFNVNITFDEYLNLNKYINDEKSPYIYELIGVICHFGSNDMGGHFIAFCKNYNNCEWYKYNDQIVTKCYFSEVKKSGLPYVLFYNYVLT